MNAPKFILLSIIFTLLNPFLATAGKEHHLETAKIDEKDLVLINKLLNKLSPATSPRWVLNQTLLGLDPDQTNDENSSRVVEVLSEAKDVSIRELSIRLIEKNDQPYTIPEAGIEANHLHLKRTADFTSYFRGGGQWEKWKQDNSDFVGVMNVSAPVFDPKSRLGLFYYDVHNDLLHAAGYIVLFRIVDGEVEILLKEGLWIS